MMAQIQELMKQQQLDLAQVTVNNVHPQPSNQKVPVEPVLPFEKVATMQRSIMPLLFI